VPFWWNGTFEVETLARYKEETLDLLAESRNHMAALGAEAGSQEQQKKIKKDIQLERDLVKALERLRSRGMQAGLSWIIGFPGESHDSMRATLRMAAEIKHRFPNSPSDIFPFRPIPGTEDFDSAVKLGYQPPRTLEQWGSSLEYKFAYDDIGLPWEIIRTWKRYGVASTFYDSLAQEGASPVRSLMKRISGWRLRNNNYTFPLEQKLFHVYVRLSGHHTQGERARSDTTSGVTPHAPSA